MSSRFGGRAHSLSVLISFFFFVLQNDYRVIAIDVRGMGASGHPGDVESSASMVDFVDDLVCVLGHAKVAGKPICIGSVNLAPRVCLR